MGPLYGKGMRSTAPTEPMVPISQAEYPVGAALEPRGGVLVRFVDPASSLSSSGLLAGDVIVEINRRKIASLKDLSGSCQELSGPLAVRVLRGEDSIYLLLD